MDEKNKRQNDKKTSMETNKIKILNSHEKKKKIHSIKETESSKPVEEIEPIIETTGQLEKRGKNQGY